MANNGIHVSRAIICPKINEHVSPQSFHHPKMLRGPGPLPTMVDLHQPKGSAFGNTGWPPSNGAGEPPGLKLKLAALEGTFSLFVLWVHHTPGQP